MSFTYVFETTPAYLLITLNGVMDNLIGIHDFGQAFGKYISSGSAAFVLVDERELIHKLSKQDLLSIAEKVASNYTLIKKFALVGSREDAKQRDLFAGFATALDFRMCSFENIEEAKQWLIEG